MLLIDVVQPAVSPVFFQQNVDYLICRQACLASCLGDCGSLVLIDRLVGSTGSRSPFFLLAVSESLESTGNDYESVFSASLQCKCKPS